MMRDPAQGLPVMSHGACGRISVIKSSRRDLRVITDPSNKNFQINAPDTQRQIMSRKA